MVEPFTGEGITFALSTGVLAAEAALTSLGRTKPAAALSIYSNLHRRLYRRRAWVNTLVRWLLVTPSRTVRLLRKVDRLPAAVTFLSQRVHAST